MNDIGEIRTRNELAADERWLLVMRLAESRHFRRAVKLRNFLLFVCEASLTGRADDIREQQIGWKVYGRKPDYDISNDNIVRVEARELRKRLDAYFADEGIGEPLVLQVPKWGYAPVFEARVVSVPEPAAGGHPAIPEQPDGQATRQRRAIQALAIVCGLLGLSVALLLVRGSGEPGPDSSLAIYRDLLGSESNEVLISLSNPPLYLYHDWPLDLPLYPGQLRLPSDMESQVWGHLKFSDSQKTPGVFTLSAHEYTGLGEAVAAYSLGRLIQRLGRPARLTQSRFVSWDGVQNGTLIILGSPHIGEWTRTNVPRLKYEVGGGGVRNLQPSAKEPSEYTGGTCPDGPATCRIDYGVITSVLWGQSKMIILAGRQSAGTYGVGEFFADPARMGRVHARVRTSAGAIPPIWQVLLRFKIRDSIPIESEVVSTYTAVP